MRKFLVALLMVAGLAHAEGESSGDFDYYLLSLSWTPSWCETTGDARGSEQCDAGQGFGFTLHGLWPQYETGWPSYCRHNFRQATRAQTAEMADIMGTSGLAWHQWKKHGTCAGMTAEAYFELSRAAYAKINRPEIFSQLPREIDILPRVVQEAFIETNPELRADQIEITCKDGYIQEARICLTKDLAFRKCSEQRRSCNMTRPYDLAPIR